LGAGAEKELAARVEDIEGIGSVYARKLAACGVKSVRDLLTHGATPKGRLNLAKQAGISEDRILEWVNRADLYRIPGIRSEYSDLLEVAGVDTVVELATRNPANLLETL
jgi:predicted flap endonuclease-1-like 5' DNA nuclease